MFKQYELAYNNLQAICNITIEENLAAVLTANKRLILFTGIRRYAMTDYIDLECPSCGSQLQINPNLERIVCESCKEEFTTNRSGEAITISPIKVSEESTEAGPERTPAETAIHHLKEDIAQLEKDLSNLKNRKGIAMSSLLWLAPIALIAIGVFVLLAFSSVDAAVWLIAIGLAVALFISLGNIEKSKQCVLKIKRLEEDLDQKQRELTQHLQIASNGK